METKDVIKKGNKMIAEFMGYTFYKNGTTIFPNGYWFHSHKKTKSDDELEYSTSWDWIMPVAEKISTEHDFVLSSTGMWACYINRKDSDINDSIADFGGFEPLIMNVWKCC